MLLRKSRVSVEKLRFKNLLKFNLTFDVILNLLCYFSLFHRFWKFAESVLKEITDLLNIWLRINIDNNISSIIPSHHMGITHIPEECHRHRT